MAYAMPERPDGRTTTPEPGSIWSGSRCASLGAMARHLQRRHRASGQREANTLVDVNAVAKGDGVICENTIEFGIKERLSQRGIDAEVETR